LSGGSERGGDADPGNSCKEKQNGQQELRANSPTHESE